MPLPIFSQSFSELEVVPRRVLWAGGNGSVGKFRNGHQLTWTRGKNQAGLGDPFRYHWVRNVRELMEHSFSVEPIPLLITRLDQEWGEKKVSHVISRCPCHNIGKIGPRSCPLTALCMNTTESHVEARHGWHGRNLG